MSYFSDRYQGAGAIAAAAPAPRSAPAPMLGTRGALGAVLAKKLRLTGEGLERGLRIVAPARTPLPVNTSSGGGTSLTTKGASNGTGFTTKQPGTFVTTAVTPAQPTATRPPIAPIPVATAVIPVSPTYTSYTTQVTPPVPAPSTTAVAVAKPVVMSPVLSPDVAQNRMMMQPVISLDPATDTTKWIFLGASAVILYSLLK